MSSLKPYQNENPSPLSRRFFAFCIDLILVVALHALAFVISGNIISNTNSYKQIQSSLEAEMNECYKITEESHVYEFEGTDEKKYQNPVSQEKVFTKWAYAHIRKSFNIDNTVFVKNGVTKLDIDDSIQEASYTTDNIAYFYHTFVRNRNDSYKIVDLKGVTIEKYYYDFFKKHAFSYNDVSLWIYDEMNYTIPILKGDFAYNLYNYLKVDPTSQEGLSCYNLLARSYQDMWNVEVDLLLNCNEYQIHYNKYQDCYSSLTRMLDIDCVISYIVVFLLVYTLPTIITKKHQSLGKKLEKVLVVDIDGYPVVGWQIAVRNICKLFGFFGFTVISNFICAGANSAWVYPLFYIGSLGVSILTINIAFLIIAFVSFLIGAFHPKKRDLADLICHTYIIDIRDFMEHNQEAIMVNNQNATQKEEIEVIDSTTIRKS